MRQHDRGTIDLLDHFGHREGFARTGHAQQHLVAVAVVHTPNELGDGLGLIAARLVVTGKLEVHVYSRLSANSARVINFRL